MGKVRTRMRAGEQVPRVHHLRWHSLSELCEGRVATFNCVAGNPTLLNLVLTTHKSLLRASYRLGSAPRTVCPLT